MRNAIGVRYALRFVCVCGAYIVTARAGLAMEAIGGVATTVWPPSGIALGALLLGGNALWPAVCVGAFVANLSTGVPAATAVGIALGNTLEALLAAFLVRRFGGMREAAFGSLRQTLALVVLAALASTAVAATVGVTSAWLGSMIRADAFGTVWWNWWIGDALGILLVVPVMFGLTTFRRASLRPEKPIEAALTFFVLCGVSAFVFGWKLPRPFIPHAYAVFPPLFWVALRFRQQTTAYATLLVAVVALIGTTAGAGPFVTATRSESLLSLQAFMIVVTVTTLILGAVSTERERARRRLADEHAFISAVLDTGGILVVLDEAGHIVRLTRACARLLGARPQLAHEQFFWDVFAVPEEKTSVQAAFTALVRARAPAEWESRSDGGEAGSRTVLWSSAPLLDDAGRVKYVISSGNDLTDHRRLESQLVLSDRLAAVGTLAAGVGHEINNPLAYLILCLEMATNVAARHEDSDELRNLLGMAREGAERVAKIVGDLRILSRADHGNKASGAVDVHAVLDSSIRIAWNQIRHRAQLVKRYGSIHTVQADTGRLGQVFLNLLMNAAQAIPEGYADRNMIRVSTEMKGDDQIVVSISDTGAGVESDVQKRLFEPFFTTKPIGEGVGLGLSVSHAIVTGLGGSIGVESAPGRGTLFRVQLPASQIACSPSEDTHEKSLVVSPLRILIVDDEVNVAHSLALVLEKHDVTCANSGHEALELFQARDFDIVFCDLLMPELTGMDFYDKVCELKPGYEARIVFMTGGAFTARSQQFLARVANRTIDKPFDFALLTDLIAERAQDKANLH
jgi:PAS domain S-box-containing protein